ncbi:double-stranded DNA-binding protein [Thermococcus onnurineus NA1]|uniref:DNA-binding protein TON_1102 n=1 Tax=Thermococcus onnurineus (strain NA1) TaxID=523850 RepID=Y1102_THEON|nr:MULTISPECIES: DNA-binding protein [Thermococcus]B6YWX7.1 RecName: Full=DNA-binding protein TON_1102 [Thermococcus onnurineus NA1]ACJ16590.1 double-stranded DNA-binding protein [Thermococcus onnurineus NA1]NJD99744.1 DNA-binding protein [Thermococcus sp. LS1]NJE47435.1 DNA-binding protein [Thermococcus sp. GR7]NJE79268.1 DNA-binding protein [Thermococcus sp. GR4]NJF23485.1 DNA-binding protein [Thermococcus sp. GR5]
MAEDIEEIRKKKLLELQKRYLEQQKAQEEAIRQEMELEAQLNAIMRHILTPEARERLGRVKLVRPELARQVELVLVQLYQAGQIREPIDDAKLKKILAQIDARTRRDFRIKW